MAYRVGELVRVNIPKSEAYMALGAREYNEQTGRISHALMGDHALWLIQIEGFVSETGIPYSFLTSWVKRVTEDEIKK